MPASLVLHLHPFASYCRKVLIALYELDVPFEPHVIDGAEGRARSRWLAGDAFTVADCAAASTLFSCRTVHRRDEAGQASITR